MDGDGETVLTIDDEEDESVEESVEMHFVIKGKLFNGCRVKSNCKKI